MMAVAVGVAYIAGRGEKVSTRTAHESEGETAKQFYICVYQTQMLNTHSVIGCKETKKKSNDH